MNSVAELQPRSGKRSEFCKARKLVATRLYEIFQVLIEKLIDLRVAVVIMENPVYALSKQLD